MNNTKEIILSFISSDKKKAVESLVDKIISFYGENIELTRTDKAMSSFTRDLKTLDGKLIPYGKIELTTTGNIEEALVHELLHLALPLKTGLYTLEASTSDTHNFFAVYNNMAEHDLIISDFLAMGYELDKFLAGGFTVDYKKETKESKGWWIYEYIRNVLTKNHVPNRQADEMNKAISSIRQNGEKFYPGIQEDFKIVYKWIKKKKTSPIEDHPILIRELVGTLGFGWAGKYLKPSNDGTLLEIKFSQ